MFFFRTETKVQNDISFLVLQAPLITLNKYYYTVINIIINL